ncbi:unnamed protein product [Anisakis simplex]|uniref:Transposase n=1 Tax=Anisakis simplex TaxID=6269 RepID=A0A0M3K8I0_ANISI|nr:unnamed protein product [Anisakis simplex]
MLDKLISVVREKNWHEAERLFHEQWSHECPLIFAPNPGMPWDVKVDETKISTFLSLYSYAVKQHTTIDSLILLYCDFIL